MKIFEFNGRVYNPNHIVIVGQNDEHDFEDWRFMINLSTDTSVSCRTKSEDELIDKRKQFIELWNEALVEKKPDTELQLLQITTCIKELQAELKSFAHYYQHKDR